MASSSFLQSLAKEVHTELAESKMIHPTASHHVSRELVEEMERMTQVCADRFVEYATHFTVYRHAKYENEGTKRRARVAASEDFQMNTTDFDLAWKRMQQDCLE